MHATLAAIPMSKSKRKAGCMEWVCKALSRGSEILVSHVVWLWQTFDMLKTKLQYKRAPRWVVRNQEKRSSENMAEALLLNNWDFWDEVKKKQSGGSASPTIVDEVQGDSEICNLFSQKYEELYQSVSYNENEMNVLMHELDVLSNDKCSNGQCYSEHAVHVGDVRRCIEMLKRGKADDASGFFCSDNLITTCPELLVHLSFLQ